MKFSEIVVWRFDVLNYYRRLEDTCRMVFIVSILVACATISFFDDHMAAEVKASIWVAVGTIFLAAVTLASVLQTRQLVTSEDRRHQQTFAPLLVMTVIPRSNMQFAANIRNDGQGTAIDVRVTLSGYLVYGVLNFVNRSIANPHRMHQIAFVPPGQERGLSFPLESEQFTEQSLRMCR